MSSTFSFGFENDSDLSDEPSAHHDLETPNFQPSSSSNIIPPQLHSMTDMLATLPSHLFYSTLSLQDFHGTHFLLARRELFDVRTQLMAEDDLPENQKVAGLSDDIIPTVYEGGFKTWECSLDLAKFLMASDHLHEHRLGRDLTVIEMGCGTAVPALSILQQHLVDCRQPAGRAGKLHLCLADFNQKVLELATVPNILLTTHLTSISHNASNQQDLEITQDFLADFQQTLSAHNITISAISGSWSADFPPLAPPQSNATLLVLASETIYSPSSIRSFTEVLLALLRLPNNLPPDGSSAGSHCALVAAKKIYFGVGGGIDEFLRVLGEMHGQGTVVWETEAGAGVGRAIIEVRA